MTLSWQDSLFAPEPGPPLSFERLVRHRLDESSWVDEVPGWAPDHAAVFDLLAADAPWQQRERWMYDRTVLEPRMVAGWSGCGACQHTWQHTGKALKFYEATPFSLHLTPDVVAAAVTTLSDAVPKGHN